MSDSDLLKKIAISLYRKGMRCKDIADVLEIKESTAWSYLTPERKNRDLLYAQYSKLFIEKTPTEEIARIMRVKPKRVKEVYRLLVKTMGLEPIDFYRGKNSTVVERTLSLRAEGKSYKEISRILGISYQKAYYICKIPRKPVDKNEFIEAYKNQKESIKSLSSFARSFGVSYYYAKLYIRNIEKLPGKSEYTS